MAETGGYGIHSGALRDILPRYPAIVLCPADLHLTRGPEGTRPVEPGAGLIGFVGAGLGHCGRAVPSLPLSLGSELGAGDGSRPAGESAMDHAQSEKSLA
jgi:hypothetical protein